MSELAVPWLRSGAGASPSEGGCILQVIDWIDRHQWTDSPVCVHPTIARVAIKANDMMKDGERQKLLDLAPRIMGTASDDKTLSVRLAVFSARHVLHIFEEKCPDDNRPRLSIEAAEAWLENPTEENRHNNALEARRNASASAYAAADAAAAAAAAAADAQPVYDFLVALIDEYDRLTGRGKVESVDLSPAAYVMAGVA